jgi:voltage-gated potassium channel Kch
MITSLALATLMVVTTVVIHFVGLQFVIRILNSGGFRPGGRSLKLHDSLLAQAVLLIMVVLGLVLIHSLQIWAYAVLYVMLGAFPDFETSLYYSTTAFTTVGFGDVVLPQAWRLLGAIEAANGFILFGWSIAFLMSLTGKLRSFEHDWLEK